MPTPWDQKKKAEMARMLAEAEAEAIKGSDTPDSLLSTRGFTFGGDEGGWEAFKAGFGKEATYGFGDEAAAALSGVETTDEERIAANEEMDAVINKNAINAALGFVGGVVPSIATLGYGAITNAATKAAALAATKVAALAATKAAGPAAGAAAGKLAAKEVIKKITPLKAIGINAAEGAVSGAGEGEGVEGRIKGAAIGGTIGALVGSGTQAIPGVTRAVADTISNDRKIQNAASEMAKEDADRLARELAFQEGIKVSKFKVAPPNPHLNRDIADIEAELIEVNRQRVKAHGGGSRPADIDPAESRSAVLAAVQQERAAEAAAELPPSVKLERVLAEKEYQDQLDALAIVPSVPKVRSDAIFNSLQKTGGFLSEDDVGSILTGVTSDASSKPGSLKPDTFKHPLLSEPIEAARKSGAKNLKILENWEMPIYAYPPGVKPGREGRTLIMIDGKPVDYANALDHLALMNKDIAPIGVPMVRPLGYPPVPGVGPNDIKYKYDVKSFLGQGVYGSVYRVVDREGRARAAKVLNPGRMSPHIIANTRHERAVSETFRELRQNATKEELELYFKHFPVFHQILDNPLDSNGFITVMDELRPMTIEEKTALMSGQAALYDLLKSRNHFDNFTDGPPPRPDPNLTFGLPRSFNVQPFLRPTDNAARTGLLASDYKNMTPKIRKLYTALEYMSNTYGMHWEDLHSANILVDKKTGEYVANDIGLFWNRGVKPPDSAINDEARDQAQQQVANDLAREQIQRKMPADMRPEDPYADMYLSDYEREMAEVADEEARILNYERWVARRIAKAQAERLPSTKK